MTYAAWIVEAAQYEMVSEVPAFLNSPLVIRGRERAEEFVVLSGDWARVLEELTAALVKDPERWVGP